MKRINRPSKLGDGNEIRADTTRNDHLDENLVDDAKPRRFGQDTAGSSIKRSDTTFGSKLTAKLNSLSHISERSEMLSPLQSPEGFTNVSDRRYVSDTIAEDMDDEHGTTDDVYNNGLLPRSPSPANGLYKDEPNNNNNNNNNAEHIPSQHQPSPKPARPAYSGTATPSFQNHTKASLAKQNEKVEIVSRSPSLKHPLSDTRRSSIVFDHRSQKSSPGERSSPGLAPPRSATLAGRHAMRDGEGFGNTYGRQRSRSVNDYVGQQGQRDSSALRGVRPQVYARDDEGRGHNEEDIEIIKHLKNKLGVLRQEKLDWAVEREELLSENQRLERELCDAEIERGAMTSQVAAGQEESNIAIDDDSMPIGLLTNEALTYRPKASGQDQATQTQEEDMVGSEYHRMSVDQLERRLAESQQQLATKDDSLAAMTEHAEQLDVDLTTSNDMLGKMQQDFENLSNVTTQELVDQISSDPATEQYTFPYLRDVVMSTPEAVSLHSTLIQLFDHLASTIHSLHSTVDTLSLQPGQQQLDFPLPATNSAPPSPSPSPPPWYSDHLTWHALYLTTLSSLRTLHRRFTLVQSTAAQATTLSHTAKTLRKELKRTLTSLSHTKALAHHHRALAHAWRSESLTLKKELESRTEAWEDAKERQTQEMLGCVRAYWEKVGDERYWDLQGCLGVIGELEGEVEGLSGALEEGKGREGVLVGVVEELNREVAEYKEHVGRLERAVILGGGLAEAAVGLDTKGLMWDVDEGEVSESTTLIGTESTTLGKGKQRQRQKQKEPYIPRCHLPSSIDKREAQLQTYRAQQSQKNADEEKTLHDILEKARKRKLCQLGIKYPPERRDWKVVLAKSNWERWDGEEWKIEEAEERDVGLVEELREKGLLK